MARYKQKSRKVRARLVRSMAKSTKRGKGKISKRKAYKKYVR